MDQPPTITCPNPDYNTPKEFLDLLLGLAKDRDNFDQILDQLDRYFRAPLNSQDWQSVVLPLARELFRVIVLSGGNYALEVNNLIEELGKDDLEAKVRLRGELGKAYAEILSERIRSKDDESIEHYKYRLNEVMPMVKQLFLALILSTKNYALEVNNLIEELGKDDLEAKARLRAVLAIAYAEILSEAIKSKDDEAIEHYKYRLNEVMRLLWVYSDRYDNDYTEILVNTVIELKSILFRLEGILYDSFYRDSKIDFLVSLESSPLIHLASNSLFDVMGQLGKVVFLVKPGSQISSVDGYYSLVSSYLGARFEFTIPFDSARMLVFTSGERRVIVPNLGELLTDGKIKIKVLSDAESVLGEVIKFLKSSSGVTLPSFWHKRLYYYIHPCATISVPEDPGEISILEVVKGLQTYIQGLEELRQISAA